MYDYAKEFVVFSAFGMILAIDLFGIGSIIYSVIGWVKKICSKTEAETKE